MKIIPGLNDFATLRPDLMKEWDFAKNGDVSPQQLSEKTDKKCGGAASSGMNGKHLRHSECEERSVVPSAPTM